MDDRTKTVAATGIIIGVILIVIIIGVLLTGKKVLSPVPDEGAIKIIFLTPSPAPPAGVLASPSAASTMTPTPKAR